jgi:hypothetical protein
MAPAGQSRAGGNESEVLWGIPFISTHHWDQHPAVGLSSLCLGAPGAASAAVWLCVLGHAARPYCVATLVQLVIYPVLALMFGGAALTSLLADYVYVRQGHRSAYGRLDVVWASLTFQVAVFGFALRAPAREAAAAVALIVLAFVLSGRSDSFHAWVVRHSLWHVVGGGAGIYTSLRFPPEEAVTQGHLLRYALVALAVYLLGAGACAAAFQRCVPETTRRALWKYGALHADWRYVAPSVGGQFSTLHRPWDSQSKLGEHLVT